MVNTLQSASEALLQAGVLTYLLLTIHTLNKKPRLGDRTSLYLLGSGSSLVLCSVLCRVARLLL
jgi:hypothetical protein